MMRDLDKLVVEISAASSTELYSKADLASLDLELKLRNTIALERIADAVEEMLEGVKEGE